MGHEFEYGKIKDKFYPIIPLLVGCGENWAPINALVDSGATLSIFNAGVARALDIHIENGIKIDPVGIGGKITAYIHRVKLNINGEEIEADVAFTDQLAVPVNLLGRKDVFENFSALFNDKTKKIILERI